MPAGQLHRPPSELLLAGLVDVLQVVEEVVLAAEHLGALHAEELPQLLGGGDVKGCGPVDGQRGRAGEDGGAAVAAVDALHPRPIQVPGEGLQGRDVPVQRAVLSVQLGGRGQEPLGAAGVGDEEGGAGGGVVGAVAVRQLVAGEDGRRLEDQAALLAPVHFRAFRFWLWLCCWFGFGFWLR